MDSLHDLDLIKFFKFEQDDLDNNIDEINSQYYFLYFPQNSKTSFDLSDLYNQKLNLQKLKYFARTAVPATSTIAQYKLRFSEGWERAKRVKIVIDRSPVYERKKSNKDSILIYIDSNCEINITDTFGKLDNYLSPRVELKKNCTLPFVLLCPLLRLSLSINCALAKAGSERSESKYMSGNQLFRSITLIINKNSTVEFVRDYDVPITIYSSINALIKSNSTLNMFFANSNVGKSINEIKYQLLGENAVVNHIDITALRNNAQFALTIYQEHKHANTTSKINSKSILKEDVKAFYRGNIIIDKIAENSKAEQKQLSLILSNESRSCAIPSLQVKNNKVKCSHGAATGKINEEQLWYLQSRGLDKDQSQNLMIEAFFSNCDIIDSKYDLILEKFRKSLI